MRKVFISTIIISFLILTFAGCTKSQNIEIVNPFNDIPIESTKRIEFSNLTVTSNEKEIGRSKMITEEYDIQKIGEYLKEITCTESSNNNNNNNNNEFEPDFQISLLDNTEKEKNYIYSIGVFKKQIYVYKYSINGTVRILYKNIDSKVIEELIRLYDDVNYKEELLYKK